MNSVFDAPPQDKTTSSSLDQVFYYIALITSFMGLAVIFWTVFVVRARMNISFGFILLLYTCIYILRIAKSFKEKNESFFSSFSIIVTTTGVALIDIVMYIVVL